MELLTWSLSVLADYFYEHAGKGIYSQARGIKNPSV